MQLLNNSHLFCLFVRHAFFTIQYGTAVRVQNLCNFVISFSIFQGAIYIPHYLCSVVVLLHTFAHGKNSVMQHVQHGTAKYLHTFLAIWCKLNHTTPKKLLIIVDTQKVTQTLI